MLRIDNNLCIIDKNKIKEAEILDKNTVLYNSHEVLEYTDHLGLRRRELYIYFSCSSKLSGQMIIQDFPIFLSVSPLGGKVRVPIINGIMKHFFKDFKNYYYLKNEDTAVHTSLADFIPSQLKVRATASNAYVKKEGDFLPQYEEEITPSFKPDLRSKLNYFELTEEFLSSKQQLQSYLFGLIAAYSTLS